MILIITSNFSGREGDKWTGSSDNKLVNWGNNAFEMASFISIILLQPTFSTEMEEIL
jgi:hypothetical protein